MAIEGTLGDSRLPDVLRSVAEQGRTGILTLQSETTIVAVSFLAGRVVSADSLAHTVEERLGEGLVAEGLVERGTIADLTRRQEAGEARLTDLLVAEGVLSREGVLDALRRQNIALLRELLGWSEGEFKFYGGDEVAYEEGIEPIPIGSLLSTLEGRDRPGGGGEVVATAAPAPGSLAASPTAAAPAVAGPPAAGAEAGDAGPTVAAAGAWGGHSPAGEESGAGVPGSAARGTGAAAAVAAAAPNAVPGARASRPAPTEEVAAAPVLEPAPRPVAAALGLLLAAVLVAAVFAAPERLLVPFPWQAGDRQALAEVQRLADRFAIDRAAKTHFLLEGHFPPSLDPLVAAGLLAGGDRVGPEGRRLTLVAREDSYDILAEGADEPVWSEAISGNFLLDPDLRLGAAAQAGQERPLVLLD